MQIDKTFLGRPTKQEYPPHYFFVHPLKATNVVNFSSAFADMVRPSHQTSASTALRMLTGTRSKLISLWETRFLDNLERQQVIDFAAEYLSLLRGLLESDLATLVRYTWSSIAGSEKQHSRSRASFELISIILNQSIWFIGYSEHVMSSLQTSHPEQEESQRKLGHDSLLKAAGLLHALKNILNSKKAAQEAKGPRPLDVSDLFLQSLYDQALGQAQEITISRAIWKGNSPRLIAALSRDTSDRYKNAVEALKHLDTSPKQRISNFHKYASFKQSLYSAIAYHFQAIYQSSQHGAGASVASANIAVKLCTTASELALQIPFADEATKLTDWWKQKMISSAAKLTNENDRVYFDVIPETAAELPESKSLVNPQSFNLPRRHVVWSADLLGFGFDYNKQSSVEESQEKEEPVLLQTPDKKRLQLENEKPSDASEEWCLQM